MLKAFPLCTAKLILCSNHKVSRGSSVTFVMRRPISVKSAPVVLPYVPLSPSQWARTYSELPMPHTCAAFPSSASRAALPGDTAEPFHVRRSISIYAGCIPAQTLPFRERKDYKPTPCYYWDASSHRKPL